MSDYTLSEIYASAPADVVLVSTLELRNANQVIYVCNGFENFTATLENEDIVVFEPGDISVSLPSKSDNISQTLKFGVFNATGQGDKFISQVLNSASTATVTFREYRYDKPEAPIYGPVTYDIQAVSLDGLILVVEAGYMDSLNEAWPRRRYTLDLAPGLSFL